MFHVINKAKQYNRNRKLQSYAYSYFVGLFKLICLTFVIFVMCYYLNE